MSRLITTLFTCLLLNACGQPDDSESSATSTHDTYEDMDDSSFDEVDLTNDPEYGVLTVTADGVESKLRADCTIDVSRVSEISVASLTAMLGVVEFTNQAQTEFDTGELSVLKT